MKLLVIAIVMALCGCSNMPEKAYIPVPVPCKVELPDEPVWATSSLLPDSNIFERAKAVMAERKQRMYYEALLRAAINGCNYAP